MAITNVAAVVPQPVVAVAIEYGGDSGDRLVAANAAPLALEDEGPIDGEAVDDEPDESAEPFAANEAGVVADAPPPPPEGVWVEDTKVRVIPRCFGARSTYQERWVAKCPNWQEHGRKCEKSRGSEVGSEGYRGGPS